ncbi:MAG: amidohydrolase family protein [Candidatus Magnetomorum sp.]|nr:amidohydrolase family protein [Candidatus Magnetomorum sp.]
MNVKYIHTGWLIDGTGQDIQKDRVLTILNHTLVSIDPVNQDLIKKITLDLSRHTILPPLIDAHVHLSMSGTLDLNRRQSQLKMDFHDAQQLIVHHLNTYHASGISDVRDGGDHCGHTHRFKQTKKHCVQIHSPGVGWHREGRYGSFVGKGIPENEKCLHHIKTFQDIDHIKIILSGMNSLKTFGKQTPEQFSRKDMSAICQWAYKNNTPVMVHANGEHPVHIAIESGCSSIEHGYFMGSENLKKMADQQIFWTPTLIPMYTLSEYLDNPTEKDIALRTFDDQCKQLINAKTLGVPVVCGSDAGSYGVDHGKSLFDELQLFVRCGYSLPQAIQSCTSLSNKLLRSKLSGTLQKGEPARFIAIEASPDNFVETRSHLHPLFQMFDEYYDDYQVA